MQGQHVDPEEAVQIHQDLQAKQSVAIHWGTFALAYEVGVFVQYVCSSKYVVIWLMTSLCFVCTPWINIQEQIRKVLCGVSTC